jgi:hypothetical protein
MTRTRAGWVNGMMMIEIILTEVKLIKPLISCVVMITIVFDDLCEETD